MRTVYIYAGLLWALFLPLSSCDSSNQQTSGNYDTVQTQETETGSWDPQQDASFLLEANQAGTEIVQYNQLAMQQAATPTVKSFAEQSASWHEKVNQEVRQIADQQGVSLTKEPGEKLQAKLEELKTLPASEFEQAYLQALGDAQDKMISLCEDAARNAGNAELRMWARQALPKVQVHAQAVKELSEQLNK